MSGRSKRVPQDEVDHAGRCHGVQDARAPMGCSAYETAAGVRIVPGALAAQDVDLLLDARKRVQFVVDLGPDASLMLTVLRRVDSSFRRKGDDGKKDSAVNDKGFEVDFLRREAEEGPPHPFRSSADGYDFWPVRAQRASMLTHSPVFVHPVISATGKMATMRTVAPLARSIRCAPRSSAVVVRCRKNSNCCSLSQKTAIAVFTTTNSNVCATKYYLKNV